MKARKARAVGAKYWIEKLRLEPHPEGGYFRQTYKSDLTVEPRAFESSHPAQSHSFDSLRSRRAGSVAKSATSGGQPEARTARVASTAIYFLLEGQNFSAFHRLRSDELWHFYAGSPLVVHVIDPAGEYSSILLGNHPDLGHVFQSVVKAGCWFASELAQNSDVSQKQQDPLSPHRVGSRHSSWALAGCTVAPGFEFEDFELARREELVREVPQHRELIERLTRE
jgi:uncharacterized protein